MEHDVVFRVSVTKIGNSFNTQTQHRKLTLFKECTKINSILTTSLVLNKIYSSVLLI